MVSSRFEFRSYADQGRIIWDYLNFMVVNWISFE